MLNINDGEMSDKAVPRFSTEMGNFVIFIKTAAESLALPFVSIRE